MNRPRSVRTYVIGLIAVLLLPSIAFSGFLVIRSAEHEQTLMRNTVRDRTRATATAIDNEINAWRSRLFIVAGGISQESADLSAFQARAAESFPGMTVVLSHPNGREVLNTEVPFGESLPDNTDVEAVQTVVLTERPYVADLITDPVTHRPAATLSIPVMRRDDLVYVLSLNLLPVLPGILAELDLPPGWIAAVIDRTGTTIARNHDADRYIGQPGRPQFVTEVRRSRDGWFPGVSREGVPLYNAFDHIQLGQWAILIGIPRDILFSPIHQSTSGPILEGCVSLALAILLASGIGRRIAAPLTRLVPVAEAVGNGKPAALDLSRLTEANAIAQSLFDASQRLRQSAAERESALTALRQSEQKYRATAEVLAGVNQERAALLLRTIAAQEDERSRIARELHDGLAQYLTALRLEIDSLAQSCAGSDHQVRTLDGLKSLTGELGRAVNRMAWELRPVPLDELGLAPAVVHYLEEWAERSGVDVDIEVRLGDRHLPAAVEATLFRVLQEATTNVAKHAAASRVGVIMEAMGEDVRLIVEDDGAGFTSASSRPAEPAKAHLGLVGMRERLALVGGCLEVESAPGAGTTLFVRIPLQIAE
jgi:signal transduction histidine kinase